MENAKASPDIDTDSAQLLEELRSNRTPLIVTLPPTDLPFTSCVVDIRSNALQIDQFIPKFGDLLVKPEMNVTLQATIREVTYQFVSQHLEWSVDDRGYPYHLVTLPPIIARQDQRASYRIHIRLADSINCQFAPRSASTIEAALENISEGGACLRLMTSEHEPGVGASGRFDLALAGIEPLRCNARVEFCEPLPHRQQVRIGLSFHELGPRGSADLQRSLIKLQRQNIRGGAKS